VATVIGTRHIRQDGREKVTGSGRYTADLNLTGMLHAKFRMADHPRARILKIDTAAARTLPGVFAVITQDDVPDVRYGPFIQDRTLFATGAVRYEGELIAAVAAITPEIAEEAARLIEVEYEVGDAIVDIERSLADGSSLVHDGWESYGAADEVVREGNDASHSSITKGDVDAAMASADAIVKGRYVADMSHAVPIEPHAVVAQWAGKKVTIWSSTQVPFIARTGVAETLEMPENQVRVIVPYLGGGFGGKCEFHYEAQVAALARAAGRPVKLVFSRREEFIAPDHRREGMVIELETGVMNDGTLVARRSRTLIDNGAYSADAPFFPQMAIMHSNGPYRIPNVDLRANLAYTNLQPSGSVRAPAAPQMCWAVEQHTDEIARTIGMDPAEFRLKNLVVEGDEGPAGQVFEKIGMRQSLEHALELIGYGKELPADEAIGIGCGWWPTFSQPSGAHVKLNGDGSGTIITGANECGTGAVMGLPILAAQVLGMQPDDFSILYQDTDAGPWDGGASGSQTTFNNGRAVIAAATDVREQLLDLAEEELEAARDDLELVDGTVRVKGSPTKSISIVDLAGKAQGDKLLIGKGSGSPAAPPEVDGSGCVGRMGLESWIAPTFITHVTHCKVDRETGVVRVLDVAASHDVGTVLNPIGAEGQVDGGVVMGIGMALLEGTQISDDGHQINPHLLDYKLQTMSDAPPIKQRFVDVVDPDGPYGGKGIGEPPCVPTPGAIANAISQVTGVQVKRLPMTPTRVWEATTGVAE
jgi:CO/xanthine dehydrogenase Mo-binding subunit